MAKKPTSRKKTKAGKPTAEDKTKTYVIDITRPDPEDWWVRGSTNSTGCYAVKPPECDIPEYCVSGPFTESKAKSEAARLNDQFKPKNDRISLWTTCYVMIFAGGFAFIGAVIALGCLWPYLTH